MKRHVLSTITLTVIWLGACNPGEKKSSPNTYSTIQLPQDALSTCNVPKDSFNTWFKSGTATENGIVTPANSVTFGHQNNCDFYQWSERMFLWITSKSVMDSPVFYDVVANDSGGLKLEKHEQGAIPLAASRLDKNGPNRLPVFRDKQGKLFEVMIHKAGEKVLIKNQAGKIVELGNIENGLLKDNTGNAIGKPMIVTKLVHPERVLHVFSTSKGKVVLDMNGNPIDASIDQATLNALIAQNGSLVYYITMVNDMYAYFLTAVNDKSMPGAEFPTTAAQRTAIVQYAAKKGYPVPTDSNALSLELKTSWIIADSLDNTNGYFTMDAMIPTYTAVSDTFWKPAGQKKAKLALVGIHIVGSVAGHPEMIWATFEHNSNTPNAAYQYINNKNQVQTVAADKGNWLFNSNTADSPNIAYINVDSASNLLAAPGYTIKPSNTQHSYPFGAAMGITPNQQDTSASASNTEVIAINNSIMSMLPGNDLRKNYVFVGATWTFGGAAPTGAIYPTDSTTGGAIGTSLLANSTMETYFQATTFTCFTCHNNNASLAPGALSHVFSSIQPLTEMLKKIDKDQKK